MSARLSEPLLIRVDEDTRRALAALADQARVSLSDLIRSATIYWATSEHRTCPPVTGTPARDAFINVRFTAEDMAAIQAVADRLDITRGEVVRRAVRARLSTSSSLLVT